MDVLLTPPRRSSKCTEQEKESGDLVCASRSQSQRRHKWNAIVTSENLRQYWIDPVAGFRALQNISIPMEEKSGFCFDCRQHWRSSWKWALRELWDGLDKVLGIETDEAEVQTEET